MGARLRAGVLLALMGTCVSTEAHAVCRVIGPREGSGDPGVAFDPETTALYVLRDEGALQKVAFVVQPRLVAGDGTAVLLMPVVAEATVERGDPAVLDALRSTARTVVREQVTFIEDPSLGWQCGDPHYSRASLDVPLPSVAPVALLGCADESVGAVRGALEDGGIDTDAGEVALDADLDASTDPRSDADIDAGSASDPDGGNLPISEAYDFEVVTGGGLDALELWLDARGFSLGDEDRAALDPYAAEGRSFLVVLVRPDDHPAGTQVALRPIVVRWETSDAVAVPERLQFDPRGGVLLTDLFVVADERMDLDDGSAITRYASPAELPPPVAALGVANGWLTRLSLTRLAHEWKEDPRLSLAPPMPVNAEVERTLEVRVAAACCPDNGVPAGGGLTRTFTETRVYIEGDPPSDDELFYRVPPPAPALCSSAGAGPTDSWDAGGGGGCGGGAGTDSERSSCSSGSSSGGGCRCGPCSVTRPPGGGEPIFAALLIILLRALRMRRGRP